MVYVLYETLLHLSVVNAMPIGFTLSFSPAVFVVASATTGDWKACSCYW